MGLGEDRDQELNSLQKVEEIALNSNICAPAHTCLYLSVSHVKSMLWKFWPFKIYYKGQIKCAYLMI